MKLDELAKVDINLRSQTIEKVIDKVEPYVEKPLTKTSNGLVLAMDFLVSAIKPFMYETVKETEYKLKEIDKKLEAKYNAIPVENRTGPRINILGPAVDLLKYNLGEEHIKNMFIEILTNEFDITKQPQVLPSYVEIVKQLSRDDAVFLSNLKKYNKTQFPILYIKLDADKNVGYIDVAKMIVPSDEEIFIMSQIVLDNLSRLNIIELRRGVYIANKDKIYDKSFNEIRETFIKAQHVSGIQLDYSFDTLNYNKGELEITTYGKGFIDICLS